MSSSIIVLALPICVLIFAMVERYQFQYDRTFTGKDFLGISFEVCNRAFGFLINLLLLKALVGLVAPFEVFSISNLNVPIPIKFVISFLLIDFIYYLSHRAHHQIAILWRLHRLHHADNAVDAVTSLIHHPLELFSTFLISITAYVLFDVPTIVINIYTLVLVIHSPFTHTKIRLPSTLDIYLSYFIITPNFHRIHHSIIPIESNSSFGMVLSCWDRMFGTYQPKSEHYMNHQIRFGISANQSPRSLSIKEWLINPFK